MIGSGRTSRGDGVHTQSVVPTRDCTRRGYAASVTLVPRERLRYRVAALLAMTWWENWYVVGGSCTGAPMSKSYNS